MALYVTPYRESAAERLRNERIFDPDDLSDEKKLVKEWFGAFDRNRFSRYERISSDEMSRQFSLFRETGDNDVRNAIVMGNWYLASWFARKYWHARGFECDDLFQWAIIGMMRVVEDYDPNLGVKFSSYAVNSWMKGFVERNIIDTGRLIRLPAWRAEIEKVVIQIQRKWEVEKGRLPHLEEVVLETGLPHKKLYRAFWGLNQPHIALDDLAASDSGRTAGSLADFERSGTLDPEELLLARAEIIHVCNEIRDKIFLPNARWDKRNHGIFRMRWGLDGTGKKKTLEEVGQRYGVTRERVRQVELYFWRGVARKNGTENAAWLKRQLEKIEMLEDLLGEDISSEIFLRDCPSDLVKRRREQGGEKGMKNEALARFLFERRGAVGKTQTEISTSVSISLPTYSRWERVGELPKNPAMLKNLAEVLGVGVQDLLDKTAIVAESQNLAPLVKAIADTGCEEVSRGDFDFLLETQKSLRVPMSVELVAELLKHRKSS
jgi:RNA polymerase primary sigma factor